MPKKTTQLTRQDLRLFASQRLTDTADGGGFMTSQQLTGADNELFPPISDVDSTVGDFSARLAYAAVSREDAAALLGANVILSEPPAAENVSLLLIKGDYFGQMRNSIMERVEAYRVPTIESDMTLLGKQRKGSKLIKTYQREDAPLPVVGQNYALRQVINNQEVFEFIRVEKFTHAIKTYEDDKGTFTRRELDIITPQALERDFIGVETANRYKATPPARVMHTQIADAAQYYGIKPLAKSLTQGDSSLKLPSLYEQLVPVSTVEQTMAGDWAQGREMWIETAPRRTVYNQAWFPLSGRLYLDTPILPASIQINGWKDDGKGNLKNGDVVLNVDYASGVISGKTGQYIGEMSAIPAVKVRNYAYSQYIAIDDTNVGTQWAMLLRPAPARGSVQVSFRAQGEWYELTDYGDYVLRDSAGESCGHITPDGSAVINLPVLPDSGSKLIVSWCPHGFYRTIGGEAAGSVIAPKSIDTQLSIPDKPKANLKPNSIKLGFNGRNASDDGKGNLIGGCTGTVNYATGEIEPVGIQTAEITFNAQQYSQTPSRKNVAVADGGSVMTLIAGSLQKGSLKLELVVTQKTASGFTVQSPILLKTSA